VKLFGFNMLTLRNMPEIAARGFLTAGDLEVTFENL